MDIADGIGLYLPQIARYRDKKIYFSCYLAKNIRSSANRKITRLLQHYSLTATNKVQVLKRASFAKRLVVNQNNTLNVL